MRYLLVATCSLLLVLSVITLSMRNPFVVIGVILVVLIGGSIWYGSTVSSTYDEGVTVVAHSKGSDAASVVLTEYSDLQCPACGQFQPVVEEVLAEYGDQIKFEYKHFPLSQLHPYAEPAARAAEAAGQQGKFFEYVNLLFKNQATWSQSRTPVAAFIEYANELGLDMDQFSRQQRSPLLQAQIRSQFNEARGLGLTGTPSFFLNGVKMDIKSVDDFKATIAGAVNPNANFNLDGVNPPLQIQQVSGGEVPAEGSVTDAPANPTPVTDPNAPKIQFGI